MEADSLGEYPSVYALTPNFKITITQDSDGLVAQATGQQAFPLFKEADDLFFLKVVDAKIGFVRDEDGVLMTPPADLGLLPGVLRRSLIEAGEAREAALRIEDLENGFLLGNALRGLFKAQLKS